MAAIKRQGWNPLATHHPIGFPPRAAHSVALLQSSLVPFLYTPPSLALFSHTCTPYFLSSPPPHTHTQALYHPPAGLLRGAGCSFRRERDSSSATYTTLLLYFLLRKGVLPIQPPWCISLFIHPSIFSLSLSLHGSLADPSTVSNTIQLHSARDFGKRDAQCMTPRSQVAQPYTSTTHHTGFWMIWHIKNILWGGTKV